MRKILSFLTAILFAGSMMATLPENPQWEAKALADIADGSTLIIISNSTTATNVALPSTATTSNPAKKICEVTTAGDVTTITAPEGSSLQDLAWTLVKSGDNYKFYQEGSEEIRMYLTGLSTNTGLRIGNANSVNDEFVMGDLGQLLKVTTGNRFVGPNDNNGSDWRTYNTENGTNYKGAALTFYVLKASQGGDDPEPETQTVYLNGGGSSLWNQAGAEFFAHTWGGAEAVAVKMTLVEGDVYSAAIPADNNSVVFVRMPQNSEAIDWDNCWNKTEDLTIEGGNNLYTITAWGEGDGNKVCSGVWSVYDDGGDDPEPPTPAVENGFYLVGTMNSWTPAAEYKFAPAEAEGEYILHTTLAENDEIKVMKVEAGQDDVWYPGGDAANYIVNAAHAGEKDIYFRPAGNEAWAEFGGFIWMGENTTPTADFTQPFTLKFNGSGTASDQSGTYKVEDGVAGLFVAASVPYVSELTTVSNVYAGRIIAEDNSSLKFGTTSKQGTLAFTLAQAIEVDSIIVNATQYGNNAAEVTINGMKFDLTAGNKVPQDCKITPEGEVTTISIAQSGSERIYLRNVRIYPKTQGGGDDPQPETQTVYLNGGGSALWNQADAEFFAHTWGGAEAVAVKMTLVEGDVYSAAIPADNNNVVFVRMAPESSAIDWDNLWNKTEDLTIEGENNLYTITAWGEGDGNKVCSGVWSVYNDGGDTPEPPAKFYVTGNAALVGEEHQWTPGIIPSENDTLVLNLEAEQLYMLKVTLGEDWTHGVLGYDALSEKPTGIIRGEGDDNDNICFTLAEAGQVKVVYIKGEGEEFTFKMFGDFYVAPVEKDSIFFVNVANWGAVRVHLWGGSAADTEWPGVEMTLEEEQINGHDVYKFIADKGAYANCIFSDKGNNQTGNLDWNSGKYYYVDAWYAKEDIPTVQPEDVVFTVNVPEGTDSVFIAGTFNDWTFEKMNHVEGLQYTITKNIVKDGIEYKYTAGRSWDYVEIRDGNRTAWAELDEVTEWLAVPQPAFEHHDFFITGNAALVGEELAWNPNAIPVDGNSYVLHLGAGTYEMKIVLDSCGASNCQQWFGCERLSDEQVEGVACSKVGNIEFALAGEEDVTVTVDLTDTIITLTGNFYNIQMVDIRLVLSPEWAMDNAKFAAVTWRDGQEMENDGVFTDWFVGTGDTVVGQIPEDATQIAFARFAPSVETPFMNPDDENFWNHSDKLIIEPSMIYTIMGGNVEGRDFCPGYWGERPEFIADGYFLLGTFNEWTPSAAYQFGLVDEAGQRKVTAALAVDDHLKVAKFDRGYHVQWFPAEAGDYIVDADHAGSAQDVYFREDYGGADDWHARCIYVVKNGATAIDNTAIDAKAEKMLRNGMILIIKGDKTYNVMGQIVK